ncbi:hypothetical protein F4808DRAFT_247493 [Astrocystis sublimbata]|nr:hypothetical protein F4808DRAFT_247493 [Astrocystis sublimbata]
MSSPIENSTEMGVGDDYYSPSEDDDDDSEGDTESNADHTQVQDGEAEWLGQELEHKVKNVMNLLETEQRKWGGGEYGPSPSKVALLEEYKKREIITGRSNEPTRATTLHIMARNYKSDQYDKIPERIIRPVIRDLLTEFFKTPGSAETEKDKKRSEVPIWVAIILGNSYEFVDQIKAACPERLPDLLEAQDKDGKNALHHIFAWPKRNNGTERSKLKETIKMVTKRASELVPVANGKTIAAQDNDGNTPIHYAANFQQCQNRDDM